MTDSAPRPPVVVLDDDPTGTQAVADVPVLLEWDPELIAESAREGAGAVHLLTNSRAYPPAKAYEVTRDGAEAALAAFGRPRIAMRGDSTLRAHLLEEYRAVSDGALGGRTPPLLLVPALPHAGRVTAGGVHLLERDGTRTPLHETEYARDPQLGYSESRLISWAEERSDGFFPASAGREVPLDKGPPSIAWALLELAEAGRPAVCVPDAETLADLEKIAEGLRIAEHAGAEVLVRCAPAFAGVYAGTLALKRAPAPRGALLVVCGSWVPSTSRQLRVLLDAHPGTLVEVDADALASDEPEGEIEHSARDATEVLARHRLAVLATPRTAPDDRWDFAAGQRLAANLARAAGRVEADVVLAKGGITSHVTAHVGLGARRATVLGPVVDGVALWRLDSGQHYLVFPGNVGTDSTLLEVVDLIIS
jgi:uncharacterized protein YgbK (DUF1537 family)